MDVLIKKRLWIPRHSSFQRKLERAGRILDGAVKKEWVDDAERRLRDVLSLTDPRPVIRGYEVKRITDGLTIYTVTGTKVGKREIGLLSAGQWPRWSSIVRTVPEFNATSVVFDALVKHEWFRRWDMGLQEERLRDEMGVFS